MYDLVKTEAFHQFIYHRNSKKITNFLAQVEEVKRKDSFIYRFEQSSLVEAAMARLSTPKRIYLRDLLNLYYRVDEREDTAG
jgi:hypothetical protein